ncbi:hypothetical protein V9L05_18000 [Bernardetia sp. Wsw4-3y2]|uniref:hypothetical protein n=1 Tax=Bernardetia sp. Wsw4-3y2 TaxID=3127471 RepID=UPI0030D505C3
MEATKKTRENLSVTVPKDISDCLEVMHGVEKIKKTKKSKSDIVEDIIRKGLEAMGVNPKTYGQDINLSGYESIA